MVLQAWILSAKYYAYLLRHSVAAGLGTSDQGETITISLEEATQIILQQQGLEGAAIQMPDGSYQLLAQQFIQVGASTYTTYSALIVLVSVDFPDVA